MSTGSDTMSGAMAGLAGDRRLYAESTASTDALLQAILQLLSSKLGGGSSILRELGLWANAWSGLGTGGAAMSEQVAAGVRRHGVAGVTALAPGGYGTISGSDIVSENVSGMLQQDLMKRYKDPVTGLLTGSARGLTTGEFGQAVGLTMREGGQYGSSPLIQQGLDGKLSVSEAGISQFQAEVDKRAQLLRTLKETMGPQALRNLDQVINDMFGGSVSSFGIDNARAKLMRFQAFSENYFPGNPQGAASFLVHGIGAGVAEGIGGPTMSPAEARMRYGAAGGAVMMNIGESAVAGARQSLVASRTPGGYSNPRSINDIAEARKDIVTGAFQEEDELLAAQYVAMFQGGAAKDEFRRLSGNLIAAGTDNDAAHIARSNLAEFVARRSGRTVGQLDMHAISQMPAVQYAMAGHAHDILQARSQQAVARNMEDHARLIGMPRELVRTVGMGFTNLSSAMQSEVLDNLGSPGELAEILNRPKVALTMERAGISRDAFVHQFTQGVNSGSVTSTMLENARRQAESNPHFVPAGAELEVAEENLIKGLEKITGKRDETLISSFVKGAYGVPTFTQDQVLRDLMGDPTAKVTAFEADAKGRIADTKENRGRLQDVLGIGPEEARRLNLQDPAIQQRIFETLRTKGAVAIDKYEEGGEKVRVLFGDQRDVDKHEKTMTTRANQARLKSLGELFGKRPAAWDPDERWNEEQAKTAWDKAVRKSVTGEEDGNLEKALTAKTNETLNEMDAVVGEGGELTDEQKAKIKDLAGNISAIARISETELTDEERKTMRQMTRDSYEAAKKTEEDRIAAIYAKDGTESEKRENLEKDPEYQKARNRRISLEEIHKNLQPGLAEQVVDTIRATYLYIMNGGTLPTSD